MPDVSGDVDMTILDRGEGSSRPSSSKTPSSPAASPAHPSMDEPSDHPPPNDSSESESDSEDDEGDEAGPGDEVDIKPQSKASSSRNGRPPTSKPAPASIGAKPKSTKSGAARAPSPSPPPPPTRPPLQTIRLDIKLGGPDGYEIDIGALSKTNGAGAEDAPIAATKPDTTDDSEGDDEGDGKPKGKKRKKRNHASEYYDTADPFIDDSELAQDERTFFAQTKQKGFYVSSGQVALLNKTPKKPKSRKINILAPSASVSAALSNAVLPLSLVGASISSNGAISSSSKVKLEAGTREEPIALGSDDESNVSAQLKRKASEGSEALGGSDWGKKRRKTVEIQSFHPELEKAIDVLRGEIAKENWEQKGRFPPAIKPLLAQVALKAVILGEYDDNFFNLMPRIFPYNKFTMRKLIKRTIWRDHTNLLLDRQNALIDELRVLAKEGFPKAQEEWEKSVVVWERRQERTRAEANGEVPVNGATHSAEGTPVASDAQETPRVTVVPLEPRPSDDAEPDEGGGKGGVNKDAHPPVKRYKLTDQMKTIIWQLVCLSNECCRIENEKNSLEGSHAVVSDQGVRKALYQRIVSVFPEGWITSGQISRDVSVMKKKYEKEAMEVD